MKKIVKDLNIGDLYFYKTSSIIYSVQNKYLENNKLCVDVLADDGTFWKLKSKRDLYHEIVLLFTEPTELPCFLNEHEINTYLLNNSKNALEILSIYIEELEKDYENITEQLIYENCPPIRFKDFKHFTGFNKADAPHIKFDEKALSIDVIAIELSATIYREVDEEKIIYTLLEYPKGYTYNVFKKIAQCFKELTEVPIYRFVKRKKVVNEKTKEIIDCPF